MLLKLILLRYLFLYYLFVLFLLLNLLKNLQIIFQNSVANSNMVLYLLKQAQNWKKNLFLEL